MEYIVEIKDLAKDYETGFWKKKRVRALDGVTFNVRPGQVFGFLGGNGAGKTTTIKILMGLLFPTGGSAKILGSDITDTAMHRRIGYSPENPYFYDYLTPLELLVYFAELFRIDPAKRRPKAEELLTRVGLDEKDWSRQLRKFSKGMMQRVGLAQSLVNDPEIVFMDEPMSGLDPIGRREVRELIGHLKDAGITVVMSTHILSDVEALCDEVAILRKGKLAATGRLNELLESEGDPSFEVIVRDMNADMLREKIGPAADISETPNGHKIRAASEQDLEKIIEACRIGGGKLVSAQAEKQSLEELFVRETS